ncbi:hypothetical protein Acsp04_20670 [Actinomadura sp. NBRC 104425]|nr:hypothetical protein Acsp04_20670 [Actinomadura sp. NBRC 104425]
MITCWRRYAHRNRTVAPPQSQPRPGSQVWGEATVRHLRYRVITGTRQPAAARHRTHGCPLPHRGGANPPKEGGNTPLKVSPNYPRAASPAPPAPRRVTERGRSNPAHHRAHKRHIGS